MISVRTKERINPNVPEFLEVEEEIVHTGGEADIYVSQDQKYVVKVYRNPSQTREASIKKILPVFARLTSDEMTRVAQPLAMIDTFGETRKSGILMRYVPFPHVDLEGLILNTRRAKRYLETRCTWKHYLNLACGIAHSIAVLHGKGCAHGDIHYKNFLADIESGSVVMLELDGVIIQGFAPPYVKGMMGFMAPEVVANRSQPETKSDLYSLAVLILQCLLFRNVMQPAIEYASVPFDSDCLGYGQYALFSEHPKDTAHRLEDVGHPMSRQGQLSYKMLTPRLQRLTEDALILGTSNPRKRPDARAWLYALTCALDELYQCPKCRQHFPYQLQSGLKCPFCNEPVREYPLIISLYEQGMRGEYSSQRRHLIMTDGSLLYADQTQHSSAPTRSQRRQVGRVEWNPNRQCYRIINATSDVWRTYAGNGSSIGTAERGEGLLVHPGDIIAFGAEQRRAIVLPPHSAAIA